MLPASITDQKTERGCQAETEQLEKERGAAACVERLAKKQEEKKGRKKKKTSTEVDLFTPAGDANQAAVNSDVSGCLLPELHVHACYKEEEQIHDFYFEYD